MKLKELLKEFLYVVFEFSRENKIISSIILLVFIYLIFFKVVPNAYKKDKPFKDDAYYRSLFTWLALGILLIFSLIAVILA